MFTPELLQKGLTWLLTTGLKILLIVAVVMVLTRISRGATRRVEKVFLKGREDEESLKRARTLSGLIRQFLNGLIVIVAVMTVLAALDIQIGPLLATAGVAGLAISFAAQSLIKDVINGFFIILWDQIRVGDVIEVAGRSGVVESLNLKMTVLRSVDGNVHYVPNNLIDVVTNMTKEYSQFVFDVAVNYFEDVDEVIKTLKEVDEELRTDRQFSESILSPLEILGLDRFENSASVIRARTTTKPSKQWEIGREFNRRLKKAFDRKGITISFPHLILFPGQDKQGQSAPLRIKLVEEKASQKIEN
ncbi:MAG TPA: mechanosensitive ion channel family protein [Candidatus Saccharicenans sp.]|jgi:small conductance mechanosensitive channel|nr:mechanosensitive ion channel family protein [Candidatus Saccharicenans sp.]HRD01808.1 mechanosensitive ion channel family protein [Candidatus Saccharicenans sp.]